MGSVALSLLMATTGALGPGRFPGNPGPWTCSGPASVRAAPAAENPRSGRLSHRPARRRPPSGPHRRDLNGCPGPVRPRRCGRDGQPGAPGPVAGIAVKLRSVVLSAALPAWPSPPSCSSWKRHPMGGQGRGEMGCGSIRPGWVRRVSSGLDLRSPRRGRVRSPRDNGHVTRCGRRPGGSRGGGSPGHVGRCPRWM